MVHEKYIKRNGKTFGPYLYENYREKGITKTRYLGLAKKRKKSRVNLLLILGTFFLILLLVGLIGFFILNDREEFKGELASQSPFDFLTKLFTASAPVGVFVQIISDSPPRIIDIPNEILVCENKQLNHSFYIQDDDGVDDIQRVTINPQDPFFVEFEKNDTYNYARYRLWSSSLTKTYFDDMYFNEVHRKDNEGWATYIETIYAEDEKKANDIIDTNITLIEVNNAPEFDIGVQTIDLYLKGEGTNFSYDLGSYLDSVKEETPKQFLRYNLTYQNDSICPFNINNLGVINITGNESYILSGNFTTYPLMICVNDTGLTGVGVNRNLHPAISLCLPQSEKSLKYCDNFSLTITKNNRAPNITSYYPLDISSHANINQTFNRILKISGTDVLYFNLTAYDLDQTPLDVYWYVDNASKEYHEGLEKSNVSKFEYYFGCEISGNYTIKAVVTDGLANDSVQWNFSVNYVECPESSFGGGGGGGGGGKLYCKERWGCGEWVQCEGLKELIKKKWLTKDIELLIKERCDILNYSEEFCGLQNRICSDFNYCKTVFEKPPFIKECYYTRNPNCTDGIQNCHNGSCEVLTDCGGPCAFCPNCHDKIQNQGEEGIDCGGPCINCVELPWLPTVFKSIVTYSLIALLILILLLVARQIIKYTKFKKLFGESRIKNVLIRGEDKRIEKVVMNFFFIFSVIVLLFFANTYIMNVEQANKIISGGGAGLLANYGFINSIFSNFGMFFVSGVFTDSLGNEMLLWDDTEDYLTQKEERSGDDVYFYANYTDSIGGQVVGAYCEIRLQDYNLSYGNWQPMSLVSGTWQYHDIIYYKGSHKFEVNCSVNSGSVSVNGTDNFIIANTAPEIDVDRGGIYIDLDGDNSNHDALQCIEDALCYYNFTSDIVEVDINDELFYGVDISNTTLTDYELNETGMLIINVTHSDHALQNRIIGLNVQDNNRELWKSALLEVDLQSVNDAPKFVNLGNKTFNEGDLFEYIIDVSDEEGDDPFKFNINYISCDAVNNPSCNLFKGNYTFDEFNGRIYISFTPTNADIGSYLINFSVMDNSSLGNKTTSQLVNFTVTPAIWISSIQLDHLMTEDENKIINLTEYILSDYQNDVNFSFSLINSQFPSFNSSFNLTTGVINISPNDVDVGYNRVEIIASSSVLSSLRIFNFTVLDINDNPVIKEPLTANPPESVIDGNSNMRIYENKEIKIILFIEDDDFLIPSSAEELDVNVSIEGPNETLFGFVEGGKISDNRMRYDAIFTPRNESVGDYNITINVTDSGGAFDNLRFNLTIEQMDYDTPNITYPGEDKEFNLKENVTSNLTFRANHTIGDDLNYSFYINTVLRNSFLGKGNDVNVSWLFAPNFTDETYGNEIKNLTLIVRSPFFETSRTWNLTINHTNALPQLIRDIGDTSTTYNDRIEEPLEFYFTDIDYYDIYYNQSFIFNLTSYENLTNIGWIRGNSDWRIILLPLNQRYTKEVLRVVMSDLNGTEILSSIYSNNFTVEFKEPVTVPVPTPSGGSSETVPIALKIIMPGQISGYEGDTLRINLQLINTGKKDFNDINLSSLAFKNGSLFNGIKTSLDKTYFKTLKPNQEENLTLTLILNSSKIGKYEILVNATSKSPKYTDWGKIHLDLTPINESQVRDLIVFTQELIAGNPQCMEITEILKEADKYLQVGDHVNARLKANEALNSCKEAISQVSVPRLRIPDFIKSLEFSSYLFLIIIGAVVLAIILGLIYYFVKRREIGNLQKAIQEPKRG
ncbi:MAG: hypothetical protein PHH54_05470 [Candidatus Nanoarchaeia archaeon]|nr:hypothetical protein [Candidatus Nanoarchaeia archaeon]MDD5741408.1 hypothetical protein [Candidatus Nanoarchaeia archaeon]